MLQRSEHDNGVVTYQSPKLRGCHVPHAFSTRIGGISEGPYASLNLATLEKSQQTDFNTHVAENFRRLRTALGVDRHVRTAVKQVHGKEVWNPPQRPTKPGDEPEADALTSRWRAKLLTVRTADCLPILLASLDGGTVAAIHAGWRGLIAGVISETARTIEEQFRFNTRLMVAAIGPAISVEHFEVGEQVAEQFVVAGLGGAVDRRRGEKPHLNLADAAVMQLLDLGLTTRQIDVTDRCTYRDENEFFSHRRDEGITGRHAAVIAPRPDDFEFRAEPLI